MASPTNASLDRSDHGPLEVPLRFGLIGTGGISRAHLAAFRARPDVVKLTAVCDVRAEARDAFVADLPEPVPTYADHRVMLQEAPIDAAIVTLPHYLHFPIARDCVEAGIPVLVEKPLTCTLAETRQLRAAATQHGVCVVAGQMQRFGAEINVLRDWVQVDRDNFGTLRTFGINAWQNVLGYIQSVGKDHWILDGAKAGGGVVISLAVHQLDLVRYLTGTDYVEVMAYGHFDPPFYNGAESAATVLLKMSNGATGLLHASYTTPRIPYSESLYLYGDRGSIIRQPESIEQTGGVFRYGSFTGTSMSAWNEMYAGLNLVPNPQSTAPVSAFVTQLVHFAEALVAKWIPMNSIDENFNTIACIQAINDSLRSGKPEVVATS